MTDVAQEREYWVKHTVPYVFYDEKEYELIISLLGGPDLHSKRVLEIGCGAGVWTQNLSKLGADVYPFDLAPAIVDLAREATTPEPVYGFAGDMHHLPFADACFDAVFGSMVVHHADHAALGREVARVLKPDGVAVFHENSARNPFLMLARATVVGRFGVPRYSSDGEYPLTPEAISAFAQPFQHVQVHVGRMVLAQLAVKYLFKTETGHTFTSARRLDNAMFRLLPFTRPLSYYQIVEVRA